MTTSVSYWGDIKYGFRSASKHFVTFFFVNIVVLSVAIIYLLVMLLWPVIPLILSGVDFNQAIQIYTESSATNLLAAFSILRSVIASMFLAMGPLFGLCKDLFENDQIRFRSIFTWIRRKGLKFTSAGLVQVIIIMGPFFVIATLIPQVQSINLEAGVIIYYGLILSWVYLSTGILNFMMPAMAHGSGIKSSILVSIRKARQHFKRTFTVWTFYFVLLVIYIGPMAIWGTIFGTPDLTQPPHPVIGIILPIWATLGSFILAFITLPAWALSMTRIYLSESVGSSQNRQELLTNK